MRKIILTGAAVMALALGFGVQAAEGPSLPRQSWSFDGPFGTFDRGELQRGYQVYKEVCSSCHSMSLVAFRNLADAGGPGFTEAEVKSLAAQFQIQDGPNDDGDMFDRPGLASDHFKAPFANDKAARAANNGALPPDLSLMAKARVGGPSYVHAVLTGYGEAPADVKVAQGLYYNKYFPGNAIAMPQPLNSEGQVTYADGTKASVNQMARDVSAFLMWTAEPKLEERHRLGLQVLAFLVILGGLFYFAKRRVWADVH